MKKALTLIVALLVCATAFAQFITAPKLREHGIVHFKDGTSKEYPEVHISCYNNQKVTVKDENGNKEVFPLNVVESVEAWNEKCPEPKHYFFFYTTIYKKFADWGYAVKGNEHILLIEIGIYYQLKDDGSILVTHEGLRSCFYKPSTGQSLYAFPVSKKLRAQLAEMFGDDPVIRDYILNAKKDYSVQYILDNYNTE